MCRSKYIFPLKLICLFFFLKFFFSDYLQASDNASSDKNDSTTVQNMIDDSQNFLFTNFNKYINLYQLQIEGKLLIETDYGEIGLRQHYNGNFLKLSDLSSRDDENWGLSYQKKIFNNLSVIAQQNFIFVSDSRNIGINQLSRLNGLVGLNYSNADDYAISASFGLEDNKLLGINSQGQIYSVKANWRYYQMENVLFNANLLSNWLKLNLDRLDRDLVANINLFGKFTDDALLQSSVALKFLQNNLLSLAFNTNFIPIETRQEYYINPKLFIDYKINEQIALTMDLNINSNNINREYKQSWKEFDYSYFRRNIDQMDIAINSGLDWNWKFLRHFVLLGFWSRSESNSLELSDKTYQGDLLKFQNLENQRDYQTNKLNLLNQTNIKVSANTNIAVNYNIYLLQYDTPSKLNYDDRDEFSSIFRTILNHKFSRFTSMEVIFENIQNHLVYLYSQRSIMNNWNKIYRLAPTIRYKNKFLQVNPKLEVLANYTIYDFENKSSATKSISLRNISYQDSILFNLSTMTDLRTRFKYQISERSLLNWHEFSEYPQIRINEFYIKSQLIRKYDFGEIGIGCNLFDYMQTKIIENKIDYDILSISPEIVFIYRWADWQIKFSGWYEFQYQNKFKINEIANINLSVNMFFY